MSGPRDRLLTPGEADAVGRLLFFGWVCYDKMTTEEAAACGLDLATVEAARRGMFKVGRRAAKLTKRLRLKSRSMSQQPVNPATADPNAI